MFFTEIRLMWKMVQQNELALLQEVVSAISRIPNNYYLLGSMGQYPVAKAIKLPGKAFSSLYVYVYVIRGLKTIENTEKKRNSRPTASSMIVIRYEVSPVSK